MRFISRPTPNFDYRPKGTPITSVIIHYTAGESLEHALDMLCDPQRKVSAHFVISQCGQIYCLADPALRAWHAGVSQFDCPENGLLSEFNHFSIGIELDNRGHKRGYHPFPSEQIDTLTGLLHRLRQRYPIKPELVLGHSDIAPDRRQDPGELFPWDRLVAENLAIRP